MDKKTHFGFKTIKESEKNSKVENVFNSVANKYDIMNDVMSLGLHRLWKKFTVATTLIKKNDKILDLASGTGDLAKEWAGKISEDGQVWICDINNKMINIAREKLLNEGLILPIVQCDAEKLPFPDNYFNLISIAFGLRNMTHKDIALKEMYRVLKKNGKIIVLEFSKICKPLTSIYDLYSFKILPFFGKIIANDEESYKYLAESIRMHPNQQTLKIMLEKAGFKNVTYNNLSAGIVALHKGIKI